MDMDNASGPANTNRRGKKGKRDGSAAPHHSHDGTNPTTFDEDPAINAVLTAATLEAKSMVETASKELQEPILTNVIVPAINGFFANYVRAAKIKGTVDKFNTQPSYMPRSIPTLDKFKLHCMSDAELEESSEFKGLDAQLAVLKNDFQQKARGLVHGTIQLVEHKYKEKILANLCLAINRRAEWCVTTEGVSEIYPTHTAVMDLLCRGEKKFESMLSTCNISTKDILNAYYKQFKNTLPKEGLPQSIANPDFVSTKLSAQHPQVANPYAEKSPTGVVGEVARTPHQRPLVSPGTARGDNNANSAPTESDKAGEDADTGVLSFDEHGNLTAVENKSEASDGAPSNGNKDPPQQPHDSNTEATVDDPQEGLLSQESFMSQEPPASQDISSLSQLSQQFGAEDLFSVTMVERKHQLKATDGDDGDDDGDDNDDGTNNDDSDDDSDSDEESDVASTPNQKSIEKKIVMELKKLFPTSECLDAHFNIAGMFRLLIHEPWRGFEAAGKKEAAKQELQRKWTEEMNTKKASEAISLLQEEPRASRPILKATIEKSLQRRDRRMHENFNDHSNQLGHITQTLKSAQQDVRSVRQLSNDLKRRTAQRFSAQKKKDPHARGPTSDRGRFSAQKKKDPHARGPTSDSDSSTSDDNDGSLDPEVDGATAEMTDAMNKDNSNKQADEEVKKVSTTPKRDKRDRIACSFFLRGMCTKGRECPYSHVDTIVNRARARSSAKALARLKAESQLGLGADAHDTSNADAHEQTTAIIPKGKRGRQSRRTSTTLKTQKRSSDGLESNATGKESGKKSHKRKKKKRKLGSPHPET